MKIYFLSAKKIIIAMTALLLIVAFVITEGLFRAKAIEVMSNQKELPIYSVDFKEKKVALTFDCAWGADDIPQILDTLKKEDIKATFFILGTWAEKYPQAVKMIADQGHDVANHSYSHLRMGAIDKDRIRDEIIKCDKTLSEISGQKTDLFRPPYGDYNNNVVNIARELGYYTIQWDVDSLDWKPGISRQEILRRITSKIMPGSILLFHNDTTHTANMLPEIIASLKGSGFEFISVSKMIFRENYFIDVDGKQKIKK